LYALIGNLIYKSITTPVGKLVEGMEAFESGQLGVIIESNRKDEFGYMIGTFNSMTQTMKKLINEVYVEELARKDAEISALQEQINPHFLYNTLESINWRAQIAGEMDIAHMIQALSVIMEANINRDQRKKVPLHKEMYYMDQYIYLIQMRYGDKVQYVKEVSEEALQCMMPKMVLQPLLENAVKHGIEPVGRGSINLSAWVEDQMLVIQVTDTGKGMNYTKKTMVKNIITQEAKATGIAGTSGSIGLRNVARRLFLLYDLDVTLEVTSQLEKGTTFCIRLPVEKETDYESEL
jgi:two-component system sensor histidine kinase YesM